MDQGIKVSSNGPGHKTKMAAMPIYGKILLKFFYETNRWMTFDLGIQNRELRSYKVYANDEPGFKVKFAPYNSYMGKCLNT